MPDWDEDSPDLKRNLEGILNEIVDRADKRDAPNVEMARNWQILVMQDLEPEDGNTDYIGRFRGEPGVEYIQVHVDDNWGTDSQIVAAELQRFEATLKRSVAELDSLLPWGRIEIKIKKQR